MNYLVESAELAVDKALFEASTYFGLCSLKQRENEIMGFYEEGEHDNNASKENGSEEKKKGLLRTIWDKIIGLINAILGIFKKKKVEEIPDNVNIEVDAQKWDEEGKKLNLGKEIPNMIKNPVKYFKDGNRKQKTLEVFAAGAAATGVVIGVKKYKDSKINNESGKKTKVISGREWKSRQREKEVMAQKLKDEAEKIAKSGNIMDSKSSNPYIMDIQNLINSFLKSTVKPVERDWSLLVSELSKIPGGSESLNTVYDEMKDQFKTKRGYSKWKKNALKEEMDVRREQRDTERRKEAAKLRRYTKK